MEDTAGETSARTRERRWEKTDSWGTLIAIGSSLPPIDLRAKTYAIGRLDDEDESMVSVKESKVRTKIWASMSNVHCTLSLQKTSPCINDVILEDSSKSGTFVNSVPIKRTRLYNGDVISLSSPKYEMFKFIDSSHQKNFFVSQELKQKYFYDKMIGKGGFAEVSLLIDKVTMEKVALKTIGKRDEQVINVFNEIYILKKLSHPSIIQFLDVSENDQAVFLLMEYLPNGTLLQRLRKVPNLGEPLSKLVMFQLAWAVDYLHDRSVIHRDIKPENILIREHAGLLVVKLGDFGLSKIGNTLCDLTAQCGTLGYMAPEVHLGVPYTSKVDIWGLGVVLFTCLSGTRPFRRKRNSDIETLIENITKGLYTTIGPRWRKISYRARLVVHGSMKVDPETRLDSKDLLQHEWFQDRDLQAQLREIFGSKAPEVVAEDCESPPQWVDRKSPILDVNLGFMDVLRESQALAVNPESQPLAVDYKSPIPARDCEPLAVDDESLPLALGWESLLEIDVSPSFIDMLLSESPSFTESISITPATVEIQTTPEIEDNDAEDIELEMPQYSPASFDKDWEPPSKMGKSSPQ